jgi:glycosyltransferase involved in cell wall biosynthesis
MVKNEEHTIEKTLASAKGHVDRWLVLDTGSTDRTREVVREAMEGVEGSLVEAPFVDFATSRNHALDQCGEESEFVLWLDADDELCGGAALRGFLEKERGNGAADREAYYVRVEAGVTFDSARVLRSAARWRFRGTVHEVLTKDGRLPPAHRVPGVLVRHVAGAASAERSRARWERDVGLLEQEIQREPDNARAVYYLGMTLSWLGRWDEAAEVLERRIAMGGWTEEVYQARMQRALVAREQKKTWPEIMDQYLRAYAVAPHRAEPLHAIALHYDGIGERALSFLFARRGYELPYPSKDTLFVDDSVYSWRLADLVASSGYWLGERTIGEAAAKKALRARPDDPRLRKNLDFYLKAKKGRRR